MAWLRPWLTSSLAVLLTLAGGVLLVAQAPQFRAGVTLVEVEVRVLDKDGRPVTGLTVDDFTIRENRVVHPTAHFWAVSVNDDNASPHASRTFVIVLSRGRLNKPAKALAALSDFVRSLTLPGDRFGVIAYHRASELTTDHDRVADFLDIYRDRHERIDGLLAGDQRLGRPAVVREDTRRAIDSVFLAVPDLRFQDLPGGAGHAASRYEDFRYLTTALRYLSTIDGEKHVVFVSEEGLSTGRIPENPLDHHWFKLVTSARSTLSVIQVGGISNRMMFMGWLNVAQIDNMRIVADLTGGTATFLQDPDKPLAALDRATRSYYVLGYYPQRTTAPDEVRRIDVSVRQPGVKLQYRRAFQAQPPPDGSEDFKRTLSDVRIAEAAGFLVTPFRSTGPIDSMGTVLRWGMRLAVPDRNNPPANGALRATVAF